MTFNHKPKESTKTVSFYGSLFVMHLLLLLPACTNRVCTKNYNKSLTTFVNLLDLEQCV